MAPERIERLLADVQTWAQTHGINQVELSEMLGVKPQHITEWKKGRSRPSGETALAMLELIQKKPKAMQKTRRKP